MEESRMQFEEVFEEITGWESEDYPNEDYVDTLWRIWQASRAAIEIELPSDKPLVDNYACGFNEAITGVAGGIRSAGLKIKGE